MVHDYFKSFLETLFKKFEGQNSYKNASSFSSCWCLVWWTEKSSNHKKITSRLNCLKDLYHLLPLGCEIHSSKTTTCKWQYMRVFTLRNGISSFQSCIKSCIRVKCPVAVHLILKKISVWNITPRYLYDVLKLIEKSTTTLLKNARQKNGTKS